MIACPNCGGNVRFDISHQEVTCDYCHSFYDPYTFDSKTEDGVEEKCFDATIFTCPQCGGEIYSTDDQSAGFCSFCGASTILFSRLERTQRPGFLIPFRKTKEDCKTAYEAHMKRAIFAPKEMKNPKCIDSFRGIYMPYWAFHYTHNGYLDIPAEKSTRKGDYIYTDHYRLQGHIDGYHKGISHDASSSFDDNISEKLAPFDLKGMKRFTPGFLSGFYADTQDVDSKIYEGEAKKTALDSAKTLVKQHRLCSGKDVKDENLEKHLENTTKLESLDSALFPVWFMSYRNKDRVAYATVNGQTGKVVVDIPIDIKKYLLATLALSIPLFLLFNLFLSLVPSKILFLSGLLAVVSAYIYLVELCKMVKEQSLESDRGKFSKVNYAAAVNGAQKKVEKEKKTGRRTKRPFLFAVIFSYLGFFGICFVVAVFSEAAQDVSSAGKSIFLWFILLLAMLICFIIGSIKMSKTPEKESVLGFIATGISVLISAAICVFDPIHDVYFYGACVLNLLAILLNIRDIISYYNVLSTRRLPQFDKKGGDDNA